MEGFAVFHEAADDDGAAVVDGDAGLGGAAVEDLGVDALGDGDRGVGEGGENFGGDVHDHLAVGVDVGGDVENDADVLVLDGVDGLAGVGDAGVGDEGDLLADDDGGELVVGGENVGAGEDVEFVGGGEGLDGADTW